MHFVPNKIGSTAPPSRWADERHKIQRIAEVASDSLLAFDQSHEHVPLEHERNVVSFHLQPP